MLFRDILFICQRAFEKPQSDWRSEGWKEVKRWRVEHFIFLSYQKHCWKFRACRNSSISLCICQDHKNVFKVLSRENFTSLQIPPPTFPITQLFETQHFVSICAIDFHLNGCRQKGSCSWSSQFKIDCFQLSAAVVNEESMEMAKWTRQNIMKINWAW